jgi:hypothetical protein
MIKFDPYWWSGGEMRSERREASCMRPLGIDEVLKYTVKSHGIIAFINAMMP